MLATLRSSVEAVSGRAARARGRRCDHRTGLLEAVGVTDPWNSKDQQQPVTAALVSSSGCDDHNYYNGLRGQNEGEGGDVLLSEVHAMEMAYSTRCS